MLGRAFHQVDEADVYIAIKIPGDTAKMFTAMILQLIFKIMFQKKCSHHQRLSFYNIHLQSHRHCSSTSTVSGTLYIYMLNICLLISFATMFVIEQSRRYSTPCFKILLRLRILNIMHVTHWVFQTLQMHHNPDPVQNLPFHPLSRRNRRILLHLPN